ncbi:MAG: HAMP domain-containing histidine kinase [Actinomycetota bacterium]|nr:HAMP domain-containing histidine kinase [Actinomycetota bacterium]
MSLRRRVFAYLALAAIASCALTVAVAVVLLRNRVLAQRLVTLERQADVVAAVGGAPGALGPGDHVYRIGRGKPVRLRPGRAVTVLAALPSSGGSQGTINVRGQGLLYVARATPVGRVVLVRSTHFAFGEWRAYLGNVALAGLGGALLAAVLSFLLARRLARPLAELAQATGHVAAGGAGVEVPIHGEDELAQLGRSFNEMSTELARAREAQRSFLESVSHELKTPLTSIRGYAEAVDEGAVTPGEGGRVIVTEADRLQRLVGDLLDLARLGRAGFSVAREPIELATVATQVVQRHLPRARELSVELQSSVGGPARAIGDPSRLLQAISNLVENALRLTPAGGTVLVSAQANEIAVRDHGPGLRDEDIPRAFERFYLHDRYRSERPVGSGLGLAIVKELVVAMGGTVQACNPPGGGAEFTIRLPPA